MVGKITMHACSMHIRIGILPVILYIVAASSRSGSA
jgi:hypothetical protein